MIYSQFEVKTLLIMFKCQFSICGLYVAFLTNCKMKIFILELVVGNTSFWIQLYETITNISISSVFLPIDSVKICIYGKLH